MKNGDKRPNKPNNPIPPLNFVGFIPVLACLIMAGVTVFGLFHIYSNGKEVFGSKLLESEKRKLSTQVSVGGKLQISKYKFIKSIWARDEKPSEGENGQRFLLWESLRGLNAEISEKVEALSCEIKKEESRSKDEKMKADAWCSLIGSTSQANDAKKNKDPIRQIVNKNDAIEGQDYEGDKELFELPPYDFWTGIQPFPDNEISKNGEYTLSIYPSVQEQMLQFMQNNNMVGTVFAYRPSNGDIYCMVSTPGWTEREKNPAKNGETRPKKGAQMNKNLRSFTSGSTMKPITLFLLKDQGIDLDTLGFEVSKEDNTSPKDSYFLKIQYEDEKKKKLKEDAEAVHCTGNHSGKKQSVYDGLGNSCNSFFAKSAELLDLEKAKKTLEDMDFYVEEYISDPDNTIYKRAIDKILYNQSELPLDVDPVNKTFRHSRRNVMNFVGEGNLMVSPIDMAVLTALFGKLSKDENSRVYFPRIWLPADETKQKEGSPELLLTEKNSENQFSETEKKYIAEGLNVYVSREKEHIMKLSDFVSTPQHKDSIKKTGEVWRTAFKSHYRNSNPSWRANKHLDEGSPLSDWSQWIDMAKTGTVGHRPDETHPDYVKCEKIKDGKAQRRCFKNNKQNYSKRTQRNLSLYSDELDLAAYIVIENYNYVHGGISGIRLDSTSMILTHLVAEALGKELSNEPQKDENGKEKKSKKEIEQEQWEIVKEHYDKSGKK